MYVPLKNKEGIQMSTKLTIWDEMQQMQHRMDEMFDSILSKDTYSMLDYADENKYMMKRPATDMYETEKNLVVDIELPGVDKKNIDIDIDERGISVKAEMKSKKEFDENGVHRFERNYSGYTRYFSLPEGIDAKKAKAKYEHGMLKVTIPKTKAHISNKQKLQIE